MRNIQIDFVNNTIIVAKKFYEEAMNYGTDEYRELQKVMADNPNMRVSVKSPRKTNRTNAYKGLTYRYMRKFISVMDSASMSAFEEVQLYYEGLYGESLAVYNGVRDWFLDNYPNHKEMLVEAVPQRPSLKIVQ